MSSDGRPRAYNSTDDRMLNHFFGTQTLISTLYSQSQGALNAVAGGLDAAAAGRPELLRDARPAYMTINGRMLNPISGIVNPNFTNLVTGGLTCGGWRP